MKRLILGLTDAEIGAGPFDSRPVDWWWGHIYQALHSGLITEIEIYSNESGTVQAGIYPGVTPPESQSLISGLQSSQSVVENQWNALELPTPVSVQENDPLTVAVSSPSVNGVVVSKDVSPPEDSYFYWSYEGDLPAVSPSSLYDYYDLYGSPRKALIRANGYPLPSVTLINRGLNLFDGQTNVVIDGADFIDSTAIDPKVYLCPTTVFENEVEQTLTRVADGSLRINVDLGTLSDEAYLFVETGLGQFSVPFMVPLTDKRTDLIKDVNNTRAARITLWAAFQGSGEEHKADPADRGEFETAFVEATLDWKRANAALVEFDRLNEAISGTAKK
jgi:hypothetical protein